MCLWSGQGHDWFISSLPQDKDIYLLDDPLAAVDTDVANHLMQKCIVELLRGKTRILCTHRVEFVDKADVVVLMDNGTIVRTGQEKKTRRACVCSCSRPRRDLNLLLCFMNRDASRNPSFS